MATKEAKSRAQAKYDKTHTKGIYLKFNKENDELILSYLELKVNNKQGLIKELLLRHIHGLDNFKSQYED